MLPEKNYYYLQEVKERWRISELDMRYYAEHGLLQVQTWLPELIVKLYRDKRTEDGELAQLYLGVNSYNGYAIVEPDGIHNIFRKSPHPIKRFRSPANDEIIEIVNTGNKLMIGTEDLVICKCERERFEKKHGIKSAPTPAPPSFAGRPSLMALVIKEFERRYEQNNIEDTLSSEGKMLAAWAEINIDSQQTPKQRTIMNAIRTKYREAISDSA